MCRINDMDRIRVCFSPSSLCRGQHHFALCIGRTRREWWLWGWLGWCSRLRWHHRWWAGRRIDPWGDHAVSVITFSWEVDVGEFVLVIDATFHSDFHVLLPLVDNLQYFNISIFNTHAAARFPFQPFHISSLPHPHLPSYTGYIYKDHS